MASLTIDDLDPAVIAGLLHRAAASGRTLEEEARAVLAEAAGAAGSGGDDRQARRSDFAAFAAGMRRRLEGRVAGDSADLIREDRNR